MHKLLLAFVLTMGLLGGCGQAPNSSGTVNFNNEAKLIKLVEISSLGGWTGIEVIVDGKNLGLAEFNKGPSGLTKEGKTTKRSFGPLETEYGEVTIDFVFSPGGGLLGVTGFDNYFDVKLNGEHWGVGDSYVK